MVARQIVDLLDKVRLLLLDKWRYAEIGKQRSLKNF